MNNNCSPVVPINCARYLDTKNLFGEEWRDIPGYEDSHEVSNFGRVRTKERIVLTRGRKYSFHPRILKVRVNPHGYVVVFLSSTKYCKSQANKRLHQIVLSAFIPKPQWANQINHKDENKLNNCLDNLEWCDGHYNMNYGTRIERYRAKVMNDPKRSKKVAQIDNEGCVMKIYPSLRQVKREKKFMPVHIRECCNGKLKSAYGYQWKWV